MAALIRIVNAFYAALFIVAFFTSFGVLAAGSDVLWPSSAWAALAALLAILCLANMRVARGRHGLPLIAANAAALVFAAAALLAANPVLQWIGGVSILPFAITLPALIAGRARA